MQHTLIPLIDRRRLHKEYVIRVTAVSFFVLAAAMIVGIAALFPAYIRGSFYSNLAPSTADTAIEKKAGEDTAKIRSELLADNMLLGALAANYNEPRFSETIKSLVGVLGSATVSSLSISKTDAKTLTVIMKGSAPTRNDLLALKGRLEMLMPGTTVDIPIDQLAKNLNPPFYLTFSKKLP